MENTSSSSRKLAAKLVNNISKTMTDPMRESFLNEIQHGYASLPVQTLLTADWSNRQQFDIIRDALKTLSEESVRTESALLVPWKELTFTLLRTVESLANSTNSIEHRSDKQDMNKNVKLCKPTKSVQSQLTEPPLFIESWAEEAERSPDVPTSRAITTSKANPTISAPTDSSTRSRITQVVAQRLKMTEPLYKTDGQRYVKCDSKDCQFCKDMYLNLELTSCANLNHSPCNSEGYFPHVGISMWKRLQKQHDEGKQFRVNENLPRLKHGSLQRLSEALKKLNVSIDSLEEFPELNESPRKRRKDEDVRAGPSRA